MIRALVIALVLAFSLTGVAHAQRYVVVNGQRLSQQQLSTLDRVNCQRVENGYYWYDDRTGIWGYVGNPVPQGRVGDACNRGGYHRRTPFGDVGSDGNTSYYYDRDTGCSVIPGGGVSC